MEPTNHNDPRVKRTRQLLLQAFISLLQEKKSIRSIAVQEIASRATVNRATFYAHFDDKHALVIYWIQERFKESLFAKLPSSSQFTQSALQILIHVVLEFALLFRRHRKPVNRYIEPLLEKALQQEIYIVLVSLLSKTPSFKEQPKEERDHLASILSWAIFGSAFEWSRHPTGTTEEMSQKVLQLVTKGVSIE